MAARSTAPEKRPGFFSQIRTLFTFTQKAYPWLPWLLVAIFLVSIALGVVIGFLLPPVALWSIILWGVTGLMLGILASLMTHDASVDERDVQADRRDAGRRRSRACRRRSGATGSPATCPSA